MISNDFHLRWGNGASNDFLYVVDYFIIRNKGLRELHSIVTYIVANFLDVRQKR